MVCLVGDLCPISVRPLPTFGVSKVFPAIQQRPLFPLYGETFFVPVHARWHETWRDERGDLVHALKDLKFDIGNMLKKAITAVEDESSSL